MVLRSFGYPASVVALLIGVGPVSWTLHRHHNDPAEAAKFRAHLAGGQDSRVRLLGVAQGDPVEAPSGRKCLAYQYRVQRSAGKSTRTLCSGGKRSDLLIHAEGRMGDPYELPATSHLSLKLDEHTLRESYRAESKLGCSGATGRDRLIETCLLPGDVVEVWGCSSGNKIASCYDGADEIESPPAGGPYARYQRKARLPLAFAMLWLCAWAAVALGILSRSVVTMKRTTPIPAPEAA